MRTQESRSGRQQEKESIWEVSYKFICRSEFSVVVHGRKSKEATGLRTCESQSVPHQVDGGLLIQEKGDA